MLLTASACGVSDNRSCQIEDLRQDGAVDCGPIAPTSPPAERDVARACIVEALSSNTPFFVDWWIDAIDYGGYTGIAAVGGAGTPRTIYWIGSGEESTSVSTCDDLEPFDGPYCDSDICLRCVGPQLAYQCTY